MKEAIRFKGLSLSRDELATEKGELALCGGVEVCDGALRASVLKGEEKVDLGTGKKLVYIHKLTDPDTPEVYIVLNESDNKLYSIISGGQLKEICALSTIGNKVTSVESIGNTLIIIGDGVKVYALWKQTNNEYLFLGERPEFIDIRFRLSESENVDYLDTSAVTITQSAAGMEGKSSAAFGKVSLDSGIVIGDVFESGVTDVFESEANASDVFVYDKIKEEYQSEITDMIWATVNKANNAIAEHNRFYAPFFVRYCYRMYDGSMYMHSAPVLMLTIEDKANQVVCPNARTDGYYSTEYGGFIPLWSEAGNHKFGCDGITAMYIPINASLKYCIMSTSEILNKIKKWKDVISSVDIFISQPIFHYNTGILIKELSYSNTLKIYSKGSTFNNYTSITDRVSDDTRYKYKTYNIPRYTDNTNEGYTNISTFFKVYSFNIDELTTGSEYSDLPMKEGTVSSIVGREKMNDDYKSHNDLKAKGQYIYNKRTNLFGLSELLFNGYSLEEMASVCTYPGTDYQIKKIRVKLKTNEGTIIVNRDTNVNVSSLLFQKVPLYYPDARAVEMKLLRKISYEEEENYNVVTLKMKAAAELNGSWTEVTSFVDEAKTDSNWPEITSREVTMSSKIYTSEVNNPFYFPLNGINTVGIGEIKGLASTTRALSQGQFGQYPLLAFSTDGIWALSVSSTGTYSTIHPLSREVCENADSITQLDQSVLFATSRGINRIVQSDVNLLSAILDGPYDGIAKTIATDIATTSEQAFVNFDRKPVDVFMKAKPVYDFVNSRVLFFNGKEAEATKKSIVMVLSLKDGTWSMMKVDGWKNVVNGYPYPFVQYSDGKVYELSKSYNYDDSTKYKGIIVTRTLTFDGLIKFIQGWEHVCECDAPKLVIYGSNDLKANWKKIGVSTRMIADTIPGYPFKYFRVGLLLNMKTSERYSHLILDVKEKYSHQ